MSIEIGHPDAVAVLVPGGREHDATPIRRKREVSHQQLGEEPLTLVRAELDSTRARRCPAPASSLFASGSRPDSRRDPWTAR